MNSLIKPTRPSPSRRWRARGFSIAEMLMALTISATLLSAALVALDVMFKRYTAIADSASTHVVARTVMHRMLTMIRTGSEFGPFPDDVLDGDENPLNTNMIEFLSRVDPVSGMREVTRLERRTSSTMVTPGGERLELRGPNTLWLVITREVDGVATLDERPLLDGVVDAVFNLEYAPGPRLVRATIDLTIEPRSSEIATFDAQTGTWNVTSVDPDTGQRVVQTVARGGNGPPTIRMIASTSPRGL